MAYIKPTYLVWGEQRFPGELLCDERRAEGEGIVPNRNEIHFQHKSSKNIRLTWFCAFRVRAAFADGTAGVEEVSIQGISMMERCGEKI